MNDESYWLGAMKGQCVDETKIRNGELPYPLIFSCLSRSRIERILELPEPLGNKVL